MQHDPLPPFLSIAGVIIQASQQIQLLFRVKRQSFKGFLFDVLKKKQLEIVVSSFIILALILGGYRLFLSGGGFLLKQGEIGEVFLDRIFYLGWSIIFYLLVLSNLITGFSTFYRSQEVSHLLTMPLRHDHIFRVKFMENLVYSSWALLILGIPLTLAYGQLQGLGPMQYLLAFFLGVLPFVYIATLSASLLLVTLAALSRFLRMRTLFLLLGLVFSGLFYLYINISQQNTVVTGMENFRALGRYLSNLSNTPFPLIPSYWLSQLFMGSDSIAWQEKAFYAAIFITTSLLGWEFISWISRKYYFLTYQIMEGHGQKNQHRPLSRVFTQKWLTLKPPMQALISKDLVQFLRTPQQWVQFLLLGFFIAIYLINLSRGRLRLDELAPFWRTAVYVFNFGFTGFILAALTARFVYPMISLEGRSLWMLQSAPFSMQSVFRQKFWFAFFMLFPLTELVALVSNQFIGQRTEVAILASAFLFLTSLSLISLSLGLGAVYAQFNESNPMKISSGYGGIIAVVLSLVYVMFSVAALVIVINLMHRNGSPLLLVSIIAFVLLLTVLYTWLPIRWGVRAVTRYER